MRVLYVSTEVHPALKTGGLADVNAALPAALAHAGADVRLLLPGFPALRGAATGYGEPVRMNCPPAGAEICLVPCRLGDVPAWLIDAPELYGRAGNPYVGPDGHDWPDNARRFAVLGWAAARFADGGIGHWRADIVHGHDWHAALAPAYLRARGGAIPGTVFTIHNLAYQGSFPASEFAALKLPAHFFAMHGLEFHGRLNFMKAGIHYADRLTTVSPTYAREIQTAQHGCGMEGLLRSRAGALTGILNGVDTRAWDPAHDAALPAVFSPGHLAGKARCREALKTEFSLRSSARGPLIGVVSRLTEQKGLDLLLEALPAVLAIDAQVVLLGSGEPALEERWLEAARRHPGTVAVHRGYDEALAHRIFGGADMIAVPSRFEPCGLTQMYALIYGALPLVRRTGGLADTVRDATPEARAAGRANGFAFESATADGLAAALARAGQLWQDPAAWALVRDVGMRERLGWEDAAEHYMDLYRELRPSA